MSLWADYIKECGLLEIIEEEWGFITFHLEPQGRIFINDMYIAPEARRSGKGSELFERVCDWARAHSCTRVTTTVHKRSQCFHGITQGLLKMRFEVYAELDAVVVFTRLIDEPLVKLLAKDIPVASLCAKLESSPELWKENTWRQDYVVKLDRPISPQQDTEAVMFRWAPENTIESVRDSLEVRVHPNLYNITEVQPLIEACLDAAEATEVGRIFIAKLKPGGAVIPHCDYGMYSDHFERFHLVLSSDEGNEFFVRDTKGRVESVYMRPGEFYWFNHKEVHWAKNDSTTPRMHLIIDAVSPKYRRERVVV